MRSNYAEDDAMNDGGGSCTHSPWLTFSLAESKNGKLKESARRKWSYLTVTFCIWHCYHRIAFELE